MEYRRPVAFKDTVLEEVVVSAQCYEKVEAQAEYFRFSEKSIVEIQGTKIVSHVNLAYCDSDEMFKGDAEELHEILQEFQ